MPCSPGRSGGERRAAGAAVRYWKRAVEITAELCCGVMNSDLNARPERPAESALQCWRYLAELLPVFEREGIALNLEPHPGDFRELNAIGVDLVRAINEPWVNYLDRAPDTFHLSDGEGNVADMLRHAGDRLTPLHIADSLNHKASSGLRYIVNPPGSPARVHRHAEIGRGEVDWGSFFGIVEPTEQR